MSFEHRQLLTKGIDAARQAALKKKRETTVNTDDVIIRSYPGAHPRVPPGVVIELPRGTTTWGPHFNAIVTIVKALIPDRPLLIEKDSSNGPSIDFSA